MRAVWTEIPARVGGQRTAIAKRGGNAALRPRQAEEPGELERPIRSLFRLVIDDDKAQREMIAIRVSPFHGGDEHGCR